MGQNQWTPKMDDFIPIKSDQNHLLVYWLSNFTPLSNCCPKNPQIGQAHAQTVCPLLVMAMISKLTLDTLQNN